jgi:hypothetical protein
MATVDKDFRVKHGLVVEGTTATVNGEDVITTGSTTDDLPEGSTNQYFTSQRAIDAVSSEITTEVNTAIDALDTDDIEEGATNLYYTTARAKGDAADLLTNATLTNITITGNEDGLTITAENGGIQDLTGFDTDDLTEGTTNKYFTDQRAVDAVTNNLGTGLTTFGGTFVVDETVIASRSYVDGLAINYEVAGAAGTAETNANTYTDNAINALDTDDIEEGVTNLYFTNQRALDATASAYDASGAASTAETNAKAYADDLIGDVTVDGTAGNTITDRIATAVSDLVDGAPALLDTLNELAAAINDDSSFATTVATSIGAKQNTLTAGSNIDISSDIISVIGLDTDDVSEGANLYFTDQRALDATSAAYDPAGSAASAQTAAESYADGLAVNYEPAGAAQSAVDALDTDDIEEGSTNLYFTDTRAVDALEAVVPNFTAVEVNSLAKQVAATSSSLGSVAVTAYSFNKSEYKTAKFIVKIDNGTENEVTEVLLTLDSGDNIAITEYAIVGTNGSRGTITADVVLSDVRLRVTPVNDSTINVVGTLLA